MFSSLLAFGISVFILLLFSAFFSGSETAFYSLTPFDLHQIEKERRRAYPVLRKLLNRPRRLLITLLLANLLVNVLFSSVMERHVAEFFFNFFGHESARISLFFSILLSTLLVLFFGEILPKVLAIRHNRFFALAASRVVMALYLILWVVVEILARLAIAFTWLMGPPQMDAATEEEIKSIVSQRAEKGVLDRGERDMIHSIFNLDRFTAARIMTPRHQIAALPIESSLEDVLAFLREHRFSRIPIYRGSIDNVIGILSVKDLLKVVAGKEPFRIRRFLRPAVFVPRTRRVDDLIRDLQRRKMHMAIVVDEYGATAGIVTLEDAMEEVVGEIHDEHDEEREGDTE